MKLRLEKRGEDQPIRATIKPDGKSSGYVVCLTDEWIDSLFNLLNLVRKAKKTTVEIEITHEL